MKINLIAAVNSTGGIGYKNTIPWHLPEDLQYFKRVTKDYPLIMGRKTFDSLPAGPLKDRVNIVVSSQLFPHNYENLVVVNSYGEALEEAKAYEREHVFVIGGVSAYEHFWDVADQLWLTRVHIDTPQDVALDVNNLEKDWVLALSTAQQSSHDPYTHFTHELYLKKQLDFFN